VKDIQNWLDIQTERITRKRITWGASLQIRSSCILSDRNLGSLARSLML